MSILYYTIGFCISDFIFSKLNVKGVYYLNHVINNVVVVYESFPHILNCYTNFLGTIDTDVPINCMNITVALHIYHILLYWPSLRTDDWMHHIIMIGIIIPLIYLYQIGGNVVGHGLFYITGLPGGIDYTLLFLNRNGILVSRNQEKYVNSLLNLWVRCPGCIATAIFTLIMIQKLNMIQTISDILIAWFMMGALLWNGVYFMNDVVRNYHHILISAL